MKIVNISIAKPNDPSWVNEDASAATGHCIAVSDGAGGCGLFAHEWSQYLIKQLPKDQPITTYTELDSWIDRIWEPFYNQYEKIAKAGDGIMLNKFYSEGSCATLAAIWHTIGNEYRWAAYGDSVAFHYSEQTGILQHSFTRLADFSNPPQLISCKDPLEQTGFSTGTFVTDDTSVVFAASDALSHYILMMYEVSRHSQFESELEEERTKPSGNSQLLKTAENSFFHFYDDVIRPLLQAATSNETFKQYVTQLYHAGLIDIDDYTLVALF